MSPVNWRCVVCACSWKIFVNSLKSTWATCLAAASWVISNAPRAFYCKSLEMRLTFFFTAPTSLHSSNQQFKVLCSTSGYDNLMFGHVQPTLLEREISLPKPNRLRSSARSPGQVISDRTGASLDLAAKARSNTITLRVHAWDRADNDGSPGQGHGLSYPERSIIWKFPPHGHRPVALCACTACRGSNWWPWKMTLLERTFAAKAKYTRWGRLWDHTHEQYFACSPPVSRLITFPPTSWLLVPWQASPPGKVRNDVAHPLISTPHRLRTSEIPMPKCVSSAVTHRCHHRPALPFRDWHPFTKPVLILAE